VRTDTNARRREIRSLVDSGGIASQNDLQILLSEKGFDVTQATISRDLDSVGAQRVKNNGGFQYRIPQHADVDNEAVEALFDAVDEFVVSLVTSGNLIVLKVPPGAAQFVASRVDAAEVDGSLGTIAGDDTILVIADERVGVATLSRRLTGTERIHGN
jgi:transcriptional regulator of arginine metabolism